MLEESSLIYLLWLIEALKPTNNKINRLIDAYALPENIYFAPIDDLGRAAGLSADDITALENGRNLSKAQSILEKCKKEDISICTLYDNNYPERFQNIPNPPVLFFYKGEPVWDDASLNIAIVGTRKMTKYGYTVTKDMASQLSGCGCTIISGMAYGIDAAAQAAAVATGGKTIGFLAGGVDVIYPQENMVLYYDIISCGCVISEYLPGEKNLPHHFQARNRLIAAMSDGVLVVQAPKKSGALITAKWAGEYNREVFAVPGDITEEQSEGTNSLIADGAKLVQHPMDIISEYGNIFSEVIKEQKKNIAKKEIIKPQEENDEKISKIIFLLKDAEYDCSSLAEKSEISLGQLILLLTDLQIKGIITEKPGGIYALSKGVII